jgi:hypothetical protein
VPRRLVSGPQDARGSLNIETLEIQELLGKCNKNGLLHEDEYVNGFLMKATAGVEKVEERRNIDIDMVGDEEVSI